MFTEHLTDEVAQRFSDKLSPEQVPAFTETIKDSLLQMEESYRQQFRAVLQAQKNAPFFSQKKAIERAKWEGHDANVAARNDVAKNLRHYLDGKRAEEAASDIAGWAYDMVTSETQSNHLTATTDISPMPRLQVFEHESLGVVQPKPSRKIRNP